MQRRFEADLRQWLRNHHGVISLEEAIRLGASAALVRYRLENGIWVRMYRGVYRDTSVPRTPYQDLRAAFVATHESAVVSHSSAAWLWNLVPAAPTVPELTVPVGCGLASRPKGLTIHRSRDLDPKRAIPRRDVLVTNPMRTIVDLPATLPPDDLNNAVDRALAARLFALPALIAELDRLARRGRPGVGILRRHLQDRGFTGAPAPSVLESKMLRLFMSLGMPLPIVELKVGDGGEYRLDFAWPDVRLTIEVDGYAFHFSPEHQGRDVTRRNRLQEMGWTVRVYTWRHVCDEPARVAEEIRATHDRLAAQMPASKSSTI